MTANSCVQATTTSGARLTPPFPAGLEQAVFGMGCFWGAERKFWEAPGVYTTAVGYAGGYTPNPTYKEVCSGMTGHTEVVLVVFDPKVTSYEAMLKVFCPNTSSRFTRLSSLPLGAAPLAAAIVSKRLGVITRVMIQLPPI